MIGGETPASSAQTFGPHYIIVEFAQALSKVGKVFREWTNRTRSAYPLSEFENGMVTKNRHIRFSIALRFTDPCKSWRCCDTWNPPMNHDAWSVPLPVTQSDMHPFISPPAREPVPR
jgi:hypothetical protein